MKKVIILGGSPLQVESIKKARSYGFYVICADYNPKAVGFQFANQTEIISTLDIDAILKLAKKEKVDYVITSTSDAPVRTASYVSEELGIPTGISYVDSICATHKDAMRKRLADFNVPIPEYIVCNCAAEFSDAIQHFNYNCIVKPADSAASRGVILLDSSYRGKNITSLFEHEIEFSKKGTLMVEQFIHGAEVSVESITINGETHIIAVTDKLVTKPPYFVELGHSEHSLLPTNVIDNIKAVTKYAIKAVGIKNCPSHTEIIATNNGPKVIEIAARLGGDFITSKLVPLSTGVDLVSASVKQALGIPFDITPTMNGGSAIRFITSRTGTIANVSVNPEIEDLPGFTELKLYKGSSDDISEPHSSNDRVGHIICTGADAREARKTAERALSMIDVNIVQHCADNA